jgi:hypothetical protein
VYFSFNYWLSEEIFDEIKEIWKKPPSLLQTLSPTMMGQCGCSILAKQTVGQYLGIASSTTEKSRQFT